MRSYFLTPERKLPAGVGFRPLGAAHLGMLAGLGVLVFAVVLAGCRMSRAGRLRLLRGLSLGMVAMELLKDFVLALQGAFSVGYLPLHLCSMGMFLCLFWAYRPEWDGAGQCLYSLCLSGGVAALLFPDWSRMPPLAFSVPAQLCLSRTAGGGASDGGVLGHGAAKGLQGVEAHGVFAAGGRAGIWL